MDIISDEFDNEPSLCCRLCSTDPLPLVEE